MTSPEQKSGSILEVVEELTKELARLNDNLERLQGAQPQLERLVEVLDDLRIMTAPMLGWKVKDIKGVDQN